MNFKDFFISSLIKHNNQEKIKYALEHSNFCSNRVNKKPIVCLIGIGPHAKRIYLNYLKKNHLELALVVELESKEVETREYLNELGFKDSYIYVIPDIYKDKEQLPKKNAKNLKEFCQNLKVSHIIISTEPKAHHMYLEFALKNSIHVLTDKPITVVKNMYKNSNIKKIKKQYYKLLKLSKNTSINCAVMCQRKYHRGYEYIKKLLTSIVKQYQIPITYIDIYHCDGNWEMPHDLNKENHPYKYGYGKLFHSGYHFIDLLSDLIKINDYLPNNKLIAKGEVYANCFTPQEELTVCNLNDLKRLFKNQKMPIYYRENKNPKFNNFGEKNFYGLFQFQNKQRHTITTASLNLLHYGFSRRGWITSKDFYKSNGRVRHEYLNIQVGPLMNIKVHSYQSKEIKNRETMELEEKVGGLEHFDIEIYRNVDLIGGKSYEKIQLGDLYSKLEKKNILGYNELAREMLLNDFFKNKIKKGLLKNHVLGMEILSSCAKQIPKNFKKYHQKEKIKIKSRRKYPDIDYLKTFSNNKNNNDEKIFVKDFTRNVKTSEFGVVLNYLKNKKCYEIYNYIIENNEIASTLNYKLFQNIFLALIYFYYISFFMKYKNTTKIAKALLKI